MKDFYDPHLSVFEGFFTEAVIGGVSMAALTFGLSRRGIVLHPNEQRDSLFTARLYEL